MKKTIVTCIAALALTGASFMAQAKTPAELNDLEISHVAYTADVIDIQYAHLALALTSSAQIRKFAQTMIRDHEAVNEQALALLKKLGATAQDNFLSQKLVSDSKGIINELSQLRGAAFDKRYAEIFSSSQTEEAVVINHTVEIKDFVFPLSAQLSEITSSTIRTSFSNRQSHRL